MQDFKAEKSLLALRAGFLPNKIAYKREGFVFPQARVLQLRKQLQRENSLGQALGNGDRGCRKGEKAAGEKTPRNHGRPTQNARTV